MDHNALSRMLIQLGFEVEKNGTSSHSVSQMPTDYKAYPLHTQMEVGFSQERAPIMASIQSAPEYIHGFWILFNFDQ